MGAIHFPWDSTTVAILFTTIVVGAWTVMYLVVKVVDTCERFIAIVRAVIAFLKQHRGVIHLAGRVLETAGCRMVRGCRWVLGATGARRSVTRRIMLLFIPYVMLALLLGFTYGPALAATLLPPWLGGPVVTWKARPTATPAPHQNTHPPENDQSASPTPSPTMTPPPSVARAIQIAVTFNADPVVSGQSLGITADVSDSRTGAPAVGITCSLYAPPGGNPPLLRQWPAPEVSDSQGRCVWRVATATISPGNYSVGVAGWTKSGYRSTRERTVTVSGPSA